MPRIELTNEEYEIIQRKRENERFYRAGKEEAFNEVIAFMDKGDGNERPERTYNQIYQFLHDRKALLK